MSEFRRRLMSQVASDPDSLPAGCVRLEYIEGTGTQWIDTEKVVYANEDIMLDFQYYGNIVDRTFMGWRWGALQANGNQLLFSIFNNEGLIFIYGTSNQSGVRIDESYRYTRNTLTISPNNKTVLFNNVALTGYDSTFTKPYKNGDSVYPCFLFTFNNVGNAITACATMRLYEYSLTDPQGNYTQHLIPILDPQGVPCMYDTVAKKFHYNKGTGDFEFNKNSTDLPDGCVRCEWIQSAGNFLASGQHINVGVVTTQDIIRIRYEIVGGACFGYRWKGASTDTYQITSTLNGGIGFISYGQSMATGSYQMNVLYDVVFNPIAGLCTVNGQELIGDYYPRDAYDENGSSLYDFYLFSLNKIGEKVSGTARIYEFSITRYGVEIIHLIPVFDQNKGEACMYDIVSKTLRYNQGIGQFTYKIAE